MEITRLYTLIQLLFISIILLSHFILFYLFIIDSIFTFLEVVLLCLTLILIFYIRIYFYLFKRTFLSGLVELNFEIFKHAVELLFLVHLVLFLEIGLLLNLIYNSLRIFTFIWKCLRRLNNNLVVWYVFIFNSHRFTQHFDRFIGFYEFYLLIGL